MSFAEAVARHFPGTIPLSPFMRRAAVSLIQDHGFSPSNSLACVGVCRDELCRPLTDEVESIWGESFDFDSLAGILTIGKTGFAAARQHAPVVNGRCRYLFFLFAHIGISASGEIGKVSRPGQTQATTACGALAALQQSLQKGQTVTRIEWEDPEQSLLHLRMKRVPNLSSVPDLMELTRAAQQASVEDLSRLVGSALDPRRDDHALISGILIHGPDRAQFVWRGDSHIVVAGRRSEIWF